MFRKHVAALALGLFVSSLCAEVTSITDVSAVSTKVAAATFVARVSGTGDVFVELGHKKGASIRSARDAYVQGGLIAMWDGEDNQGTGTHVADATTWVDLVGKHQPLQFNAAPTVDAQSYDVSAGGGYITDAKDIAEAVGAKAATIEIVCKPASLVNSGTLFACVDKDNRRIAWVRSGNSTKQGAPNGVIASCEYGSFSEAYTPYQKFDMTLNTVRTYAITYSTSGLVYKNGSSTASATIDYKFGSAAADAASAYFSIGQRISKGGTSTAISDMKVYCVRVYNRVLTPDEIAANAAADDRRFISPETVDLDNPGAALVETKKLGAVRTRTSAKEGYVSQDLIAMWDGEDNQGTGVHVAEATTWVDLVGNHQPLQFKTAPTVDAQSYDVSAGGGYITDAADIATAVGAKAATIEIVCKPASLVNDATLFACVDKDTKRIAWVRTGNKVGYEGVIASAEYCKDTYDSTSLKIDKTLNTVRSYTIVYGANCTFYKDGALQEGKSISCAGKSFDAASAYFSIGQRISKGGKSTAISNMKVYCVRVYSRILTTEEIAANRKMDELRFFGEENAFPLGGLEVVLEDGSVAALRDGIATFDVTGLRPDITCYTARLKASADATEASDSVYFVTGSETGPVCPSLTIEAAAFEAKKLRVRLTREGTEETDLYVASGETHGGALSDGWSRFEKLDVGFAVGQTAAEIVLPASIATAKYVRFYTSADGWSESVYTPETKIKKGLILLFR